MNNKTTRRERFEKVAARRTQAVLNLFESLANCSNKSNYEYTDADVRKMFTAIESKTKNTKASFGNAINRKEKSKFKF